MLVMSVAFNGLSTDKWLSLCAGTYFPFLTQWFTAILSTTEMTKIGHNNFYSVHRKCVTDMESDTGIQYYTSLWKHAWESSVYVTHSRRTARAELGVGISISESSNRRVVSNSPWEYQHPSKLLTRVTRESHCIQSVEYCSLLNSLRARMYWIQGGLSLNLHEAPSSYNHQEG